MPALKRLQWSVDIAAPASKIYQMIVGPESYKQWTSAFGDGLYFEGSWQKGQRIRFLTPEGHGVISEIAENRPNEYISIRHLGYIADNGVEDTSSEAIRAWAPAYENYTFTATPRGTKLTLLVRNRDIGDREMEPLHSPSFNLRPKLLYSQEHEFSWPEKVMTAAAPQTWIASSVQVESEITFPVTAHSVLVLFSGTEGDSNSIWFWG